MASLVIIFTLGLGAQWLGWRIGIPAILLLVVSGFVAGPVLGLLEPEAIFGEMLFPVVQAAVAIILFEGGMSLKFRDLRTSGGIIGRLVTIGVLVTWVAAAALAIWLLNYSLMEAALLGALLTVTGPTVISPMLRAIRPRGRVRHIAKWEGILNDPVGVVLAVLVFEAILLGDPGQAPIVVMLGMLWALAIGVVGAMIGTLVLIAAVRIRVLPDFLQNFAILTLLLGLFAGSNALQEEAGLVTVTLFGVFLANQKAFDTRHVLEFKENLQVLLISALFVVLSARVEMESFGQIGGPSVWFVILLIVAVRPLAVIMSTLWTDIDWKERVLLSMLAPRGIVAIALTSILALKMNEHGHGGTELLAVVLLVVVGTVSFYGLLARPVARFLGLSNPNPQGVLFVGAHDWAVDLAEQLKGAGAEVTVVDSNRFHIWRAQRRGITAYCGNIFSEEFLDTVDMANIGHAVALTANDEVNAFAHTSLGDFVERADIFHLQSEKRTDPQGGSQTRMNPLFSEIATYSYFARQINQGGRFERVYIGDDYPFAKFEAEEGDSVISLFFVQKDGRVRILSAKQKLSSEAEGSLVYFRTAPPENDAPPVTASENEVSMPPAR